MKALILTAPGRIELQERPVPVPGRNQILIRHQVTAVSTGSEVIRYVKGAGPDIGYLGAGTVEKIGDGVTQFRVGDRVTAGAPHHEFAVVDERTAVRIPDGVDFETAAYAYLPTLGLHALRLCDYRIGENVCFIGQGVVGVLGSAFAEAYGIPVIGLDVDEKRLELSRRLGVSCPLNPSTPDFQEKLQAIVGVKGIDVSVDATGSYHGLLQALNITRKWGRIAIVGMYRPDPPDPHMAASLHEAYLNNLHAKELRIIGCSNDPREDYPSHLWRFSIYDNTRLSLSMLAKGKYEILPVITHRIEPEEGPELYQRLSSPENGMLGVVYHWRKE